MFASRMRMNLVNSGFKGLTQIQTKNFSSIDLLPVSALDVYKKSCYYSIDYKINEESDVKEAVNRFTAFNVSCLAVTNNNNEVVGVCSGRDYINKVAAVDKQNANVKVKDICTYSPKVMVAKVDDTLETCMNKMLFKNIRHLLIYDKTEFVGLISIKDLIKPLIDKNKYVVTKLSDFNMGKGAFFGSE
jgi:signal-transduction protein with cAMP-binding, CBS, and nucleotidyltransferase domain